LKNHFIVASLTLPGEARTSRLVFIGRDLPREEIEAGFRACRAT